MAHMADEVLLADPDVRAADAEVDAAFSTALRGYDAEQVDALLRQAAGSRQHGRRSSAPTCG